MKMYQKRLATAGRALSGPARGAYSAPQARWFD